MQLPGEDRRAFLRRRPAWDGPAAGGAVSTIIPERSGVTMDFSEESVVSGYETDHQILSSWMGVLLLIGIGMLALWVIGWRQEGRALAASKGPEAEGSG
jgi:hypothetical protein